MAKAALTLETAAPMPHTASSLPDIHLALRGVSHTYPARADQGPVPALGRLDFEFRRGEFFGVVGPSGCGKSTLLEIIAGLVTPTSGTIEMEGRAITGTVADEIGVVFQEDATFAWLNVWDNVAFGLRRAGTDGAEIVRRVDQALAFMGLTGFRRAAQGLAIHVGDHQDRAGRGVLCDRHDQALFVELQRRWVGARHRTGTPCSLRYCFVCLMGKASSWKIEAASAASARPSVSTATRSRGWPAPPEAITGICTASATARVSARS